MLDTELFNSLKRRHILTVLSGVTNLLFRKVPSLLSLERRLSEMKHEMVGFYVITIWQSSGLLQSKVAVIAIVAIIGTQSDVKKKYREGKFLY